MALLNKIRQYAGVGILVCASGLSLQGCDWSKIPLLGNYHRPDIDSIEVPAFNTPYEAVEWASTVEQALAVVKKHIQYADQDSDNSVPLLFPSRTTDPYCPNSNKSIQGFRESFERGAGICTDIAVATAALLQDDGFPPLTLSIGFNEDRNGHEVFVYQGKDGRWGSGDGPDKNKGAIYDNLEELAEKTAKRYGYTLGYCYLNNIRHVDLVEGVESRNGMIPSQVFEAERYKDGKLIGLGSIEKIEDGYQRLFTEDIEERSSEGRIDYDRDFRAVFSEHYAIRKIFPNDSIPTTRHAIQERDYGLDTSYSYVHSVYDREEIIRETIEEIFYQYDLKRSSNKITILDGIETERNETTYSYDTNNQLVSETRVLTTPEGTSTTIDDYSFKGH